MLSYPVSTPIRFDLNVVYNATKDLKMAGFNPDTVRFECADAWSPRDYVLVSTPIRFDLN